MKKSTFGIMFAVGAIAAAGFHFHTISELSESQQHVASDVRVKDMPAIEYQPEELAAMSPDQLIQMQKDAMVAATEAADDASELVSLNRRPEFVSPAEWLMLQSVASQKEDSNAELLRLVNLLRFNKQLQALSETIDMEERHSLSEAVLAQLPKRIENREMSVEKAQSIQLKLISQMYDNDSDVRERAAEEARRIGAQFSIKAS